MEYVTQTAPVDREEIPMEQSLKKSPFATYFLIGILAVFAVLSGFNFFFKPFSQYTPFSETVVTDVAQEQYVPEKIVPISQTEQVDAIVSKLTPDQKIAQLIALPIETEDFLASISAQAQARQEFESNQDAVSSAYVSFLAGEQLTQDDMEQFVPPTDLFLKEWGFVTLFGANISRTQATQVISYVDEKLATDTPVCSMVDHEGGTVQRLSGSSFTDLPSWQEQCDGELTDMFDPWKASAAELAQVGIDVVLAPVIDIATNHPILKSRVCSNDPEKVFTFSSALITTYQEAGILPVLKHFPGIGRSRKDLHTTFDKVSVDEDSVKLYKSLLEVYPYSAVMTSHVGVENQDATKPCSLSSDCVGQLSEEFPNVLLISDALEMKSTGVDDKSVYLEDVALQAANAGNDVLLFGSGVSQSDLKIVHDRLLREYNSSYEFREIVNAHVRKIIEYKVAK